MATPQYLTIPRLSRKDLARLFSRITVDPDTQCWVWTGACATSGYGTVSLFGRQELVHRILFAWLVHPIPRGTAQWLDGWTVPVLDHIVCNRPPCCNPAHLRLVNHEDNLARSEWPPARNQRKTHCKRGHLLPTESNRSGGGRLCVICRQLTSAAYYQRVAKHRRKHGTNGSTSKQSWR